MPTTKTYARLYNPLDLDELIADIEPLHREVVIDFYGKNATVIGTVINDLQRVASSNISSLFKSDDLGEGCNYAPIFTIVQSETLLAVISLVPEVSSVPIHLCRNFNFSITQTKTAVQLSSNDEAAFENYLKAIEALIVEISQVLPQGSICSTLVHEKTLPFVKKVLSKILPHSNSYIFESTQKQSGSKYYSAHIDTDIVNKSSSTEQHEHVEIPFDLDDVDYSDDDAYLNMLVNIHVDGKYLGRWPLSQLELKKIDDKFYFKIVQFYSVEWNQSLDAIANDRTYPLPFPTRTQTEEILLIQSSLVGKSTTNKTIYEWHGSSNEYLCDGEVYSTLVRDLDKIDLDNYTMRN